ncbi:flavodoxin family protein [Testudinibacter sp. TR-2022]|uniref:NAD(P)H-dependent oxidoreductase n=1 Tax=Testudinibacter sp. TR-2022 TaxID=2585029 RepID=UPI00111942A9|nr:NAD(P)H-dependent oxidoreductase [Testudinibacter sp. TR-2022]TNH02469.1 flavodoxin family protein [Pasteurellaceae bacterium Phil31]TNH09875.1 flavodoxin family protein [Testudinibacter sp. TR-2022]TNH10557.1 flavodoxin family protein [Testudinibacter sp. TR-2022]TNH13628.1 flavodoxin family protein [Testudinibacter sp. TR-2022]TNH18164.1 flavodoxin family protein [Testudinibacter sp. TR-2022]
MYNRRNVLKTGLVLGAAAATGGVLFATGSKTAQAAPPQTHIKTLVIVSHPYPERSVLTKGLQAAAESVAGVTVRNLETIYGFDTRAINGDEERRITREHDRIVFVFPTHWFNIPPMMKAYLNDTWGSVGPGLWQGKEMLVVSTAAGGSSTYGQNGRIGVPLAEVFLPMKASALHAGMTYLPPLVFESAGSGRLPEYQQQLIERLTQ